MPLQTEAILEEKCIQSLISLGYERVSISNEDQLLSNFKRQLEYHNRVQLKNSTLSNIEFNKVKNHLNKGNIFDRAKILRDKFQLQKDDGSIVYLDFINKTDWSANHFQVTNQISINGVYRNRYDITLLINGLPIVQIELKRIGVAIKEAFNQIKRYQRHSYSSNSGLFNYIQIFIISNGENSKYFANNSNNDLIFQDTFYWTDKDNQRISNIDKFIPIFLEKSHLSKMISQYMVLLENIDTKKLVIMRPYQFYAVEAILKQVENDQGNGYIWHTTGSGKTLTSFKAAQILTSSNKIHKIVFVVDRTDLDIQTINEFNSFSPNSIDGTSNTRQLVAQLRSNRHKLILTTLQKLHYAITRNDFISNISHLRNQKVVFIFDECHRSQFGQTHGKIVNFFQNSQLIGFTGTPIFNENSTDGRTTKDLFGKNLHKYVIFNAINDQNVLGFLVEYVGRYRKTNNQNELDINIDLDEVEGVRNENDRDEVEGVRNENDRDDVEGVPNEVLNDRNRLSKIVDHVIKHHSKKTHNQRFNAIMCVNSRNTLKKYYTLFKEKSSQLKVATIFSLEENETEPDPTRLTNSNENLEQNINSRDFLENCIKDYNTLFNTSFTTKIDGGLDKYNYDMTRRFKDNQIDILLVVDMFLTGFDSKKTNTLYVDKNLRYHGLLQAFSRTNRPFNDLKSQGNIVCFRDLKAYTDEAIALFTEGQSDHNNVILKPYEEQLDDFKEIRQDFKQKFSNPTSISNIVSETKKIEFVEIFNKMARKLNTLKAYNDFKWEDLEISEDTFNRYKSKYLDLKTEMEIIIKEPGNHVDYSNIEFETELIQSDTINVDYILNLVKNSVFRSSSKQEKDAQTEKIMLLIKSNPMLKNKEHLISDFILYLTNSGHKYNESSNILDVFEIFLNIERAKKIHQLANREHLIEDRLINIIDQYLYDQRKPEYNEIGPIFSTRPSILQLNQKVKEIQTQIVDFVDTYYL